MKLQLKVIPGASNDQIVGFLGDRLKVRVATQPESGKANTAVIKLISSFFSISRTNITILAGHHSALKTIEVSGLSESQLQQRLTELGSS